MALKFLNKKGWHTGSLRNIENVWKAEQKHDGEQKKLEELRKQIQEERERSEFRQLQEAAGLVPRQERLDFLYESGLAVGKGSSEGFKAFQSQDSGVASSSAAESSSSKAVVPGALFEDKPQSANDAWRKLHSDPLLLIRQREQEALARIKNNPIRMAMIRKSVESEKKQHEDKEKHRKKKREDKHHHNRKDEDLCKSHSDSEYSSELQHRKRRRDREAVQCIEGEDWRNEETGGRRKRSHGAEQHESSTKRHEKHSSTIRSDSKYFSASKIEEEERRGGRAMPEFKNSYDKHSSVSDSISKYAGGSNEEKRKSEPSTTKQHHTNSDPNLDSRNREIYSQSRQQATGYGYNRRRGVPKMTQEEREARLREMQMNAELHEEQRWKRLKKAAEDDDLEAKQATYTRGKNFLDATQKSVYGMENGGGRATIEENVRRRTYYSQGPSAHESNAFRR